MTRDDDDGDHIEMRPLFRIAGWGVCAVLALSTAVLGGRTEIGQQRAGAALAALKAAPAELVSHPSRLLAARATDDDAAQLAETVRALAADRDRLTTRVAALEHYINEMTGSVAREPAPPRASNSAAPAATPVARPDDKADTSPPAPAVAMAAPSVPSPAPSPAPAPAPSSASSQTETPPLSAEQAAIGMPVNVPLPRPGPLAQIQSYVTSYANPTPPLEPETRVAEAPAGPDAQAEAPTGALREFAVDLAAATNVNALRARWGTIKGTHAALLEGLRPLVSVRASARPGFTEFHLVAGPVADAAAAERLCAALAAARAACKPAVFGGQSLDLR